MKAILLDTGPVIAILDRRDSHHEWMLPRFAQLQGRLVTTGAVVTEATFFLQDIKDGILRLFEFLEAPHVEIRDAFTQPRLHSAATLMAAYADTPMDFADATLVVLAEELETNQIITLDERGFRAFRYRRNKKFQLLLQDQP